MTLISADVAKSLSNVLREVKGLLSESRDSAWTVLAVSDMLAFIDEQIASLADTQTCQTADLDLLFAPTGPLQDTAIDNGWGERFLQLSA